MSNTLKMGGLAATVISKCKLYAFVIILLSGSLVADEIQVVLPNQSGRREVLRTFYRGSIEYLSGRELGEIFSASPYENDDLNKLVLTFRNGEVKITAFSSFVIIDDRSYQMPLPTYFDGQDYYLPAEVFFSVLGASVLPGAYYDETRRTFFGPEETSGFNIHGASVESRQNGTVIKVETTRAFDTRNIVRDITDDGWLIVQIREGLVDTLALYNSTLGGIVRQVDSRQLARSAELRFRLADQWLNLASGLILPEVSQPAGANELNIVIRNPVDSNGDRSQEMREQWYLDTIVLDPGHGGIDPGTVGRTGMLEKDITLDIALRLGRLIRSGSNMEVVYTRDEDVYPPIWQRTKIANEVNGKLFISIHVNGVDRQSARGFETFLLGPANTQDAIEVAQLENSVIALEESQHPYQEFSDEKLILSTMAQSTWMKESEDLAAIIQEQLAEQLDSPDRGVKQGNFYVLWGASMPSVMVEVGFISNLIEEQKLKLNDYRQKIAEGLYEAIMEFKQKYESTILAGQEE